MTSAEKAFCFVSMMALGLSAETIGLGASPNKWTADDILMEERAGDWAVSPDGTMAVWVKSGVEVIDGEERRVSSLSISRLAEGTSSELIRGRETVWSPAFSPDGKSIAFLSDRKPPEGKGAQIWAIPIKGGEPFPVSRLDRGIRRFAWKDATSFVALAPESTASWDAKRENREEGDYVLVGEKPDPPTRLFLLNLEDGSATRLTENNDRIRSLSVDPQGRLAVVSADQNPSYDFDFSTPPSIYIVDLTQGGMKRIFSESRLRPSQVRWRPDGKGFYFMDHYARHPLNMQAPLTQLYYYDLAGGKLEQVDVGWPRGLGRTYIPTVDGVIAFLADGVYFRPFRLERTSTGWVKFPLTGKHVPDFTEFLADRSGRTLVYAYSKPNLPPQWYGAKIIGSEIVEEKKLTDLNTHYRTKPLGRCEILTWKGAGHEAVEGILYYPLGYREGRRYPLVVDLHGGPASSNLNTWYHDWASPVILWQQEGAFVLQVNYHGSAGYGPDWAESIGGRFCEPGIIDIEAGVDELIRRGLVDSEKLAVSGWSYGGVLSVALITQTVRYRAASVGAAAIEWISGWGESNHNAAFIEFLVGGAPWVMPQAYLEKSSLFKLHNVVTPTIVYSGTEDTSVPLYHSKNLFRALQHIGKAPVRLIHFPGESHMLGRLAHQRRKIQEDLAWFDRYLFK